MTTNPDNEKLTPASIHPATRLGHVSLTVANLENQISFYQNILGFTLHWRNDHAARLGTGSADLLHLEEVADVKRYQRVTGLYHLAILFPDQRELARAIARLFALKYQNYPTDHVLTKNTYLDDPEGNGIELYADSPEDGEWFMEGDTFYARRADGSPSSGRDPLDIEKLFGHLKEDDRLDAPIPAETYMGHVHLHTSDVDEAVDFYHGLLGFDIMGRANAMRMAFVSAGESVLEAYLGQSEHEHPAKRVVEGQRLMQASSDIFLGWHKSSYTDIHYYWRQLKDMKGSVDPSALDEDGFKTYVAVCAACLAWAHARSGDAAAISGYLGKGKSLGEAIADFAEAHADQTERDHQALVAAIESGRVVAETDI